MRPPSSGGGEEGQVGKKLFPKLPAPPSRGAMDGTAADGEVVGEMGRLLGAFRDVCGTV